MNRKQALKTIAASAASAVALPEIAHAMNTLPADLKNNINHSVCQWCYNSIPLEELAKAAKDIGLKSIELLGPDKWPIVQKYGLTCAMAYGTDVGLNKGFNDPSLHEKLLKDYSVSIPKAADAGLKSVICFSGNANGLSYEQGLENCARGLAPVLKVAEKHNVFLTMEL
jgi:hydroxypyruvate isomerase